MCGTHARVLHFPCNPNPPRACLAAHTLPMGSKVVWKNARGVCSICLAIKATWKIPVVDVSGILFSDGLRRLNPLQSAPSPVGEGWGEGILPNRGNLSQYPNRPNTSLTACCPLSNSLPRERGRVAVGIKGSARKIGCTGCFLFFRRPEINGCKPKLCFKLPEIAKSAATRSLPCGGGLGRGHSPNFGNLPQIP